MRQRTVSMDNVVEFWRTLTDEEKLTFADNPGLMKRFLARLYKKVARNIYVVALSDDEAVKLLVESKKYTEADAKALVANWRKYASDVGYTGPVAWKVKAGYTLKEHASQDKNSYGKLGYLQDRQLKNDEPTKDSLVFWVPRLVDSSTSKTIPHMEKLREEYRKNYSWPVHHATSFGSMALLFALILAHLKRTGERVTLKYLYAASDIFHLDGHRLVAGGFGEVGLRCLGWDEGASGRVGFFLLGVEELGQPARNTQA